MLTVVSQRHRRYALLDRDGTIIVDKVYLASPEAIEFATGALAGLKLLRDADFGLIVITNQSGIARGYFSEDTLAQIHQRLRDLLEAEGIFLDAIYYCPHGPNDNCRCRKPAPGMIFAAMTDFGFDPRSAIFIGDSKADMEAATASGVKGIRIEPASKAEAPKAGTVSSFLTAVHMALDHFG